MKSDSMPHRSPCQLCGSARLAIKSNTKFTLLVCKALLCFGFASTGVVQAQTVVSDSTVASTDSSSQTNSREQNYQMELDRWMLRAYEGDQEAQFKVGVLFTNDQFNRPDYEQAVYWYTQAAKQGHILAQYNLGHQYLTGVGVRQNETNAMQWWLKAAQSDHALAQFNIGRAYYLGIGFEQDLALSRKWFERAAANNEPKSIDILKQLGWTDSAGALASANLPDTNQAKIDDQQSGLTSVITAIDIEEESTQAGSRPIENDETTGPTIAELTPNTSSQNKVVSGDHSELATSAPIRKVQTEPLSDSKTENVLTVANEQMPKSEQLPAQTVTDVPTTNVIAAKRIAEPTVPLALYTNPAVRSVLIALIDDDSNIEVQSESGPWSIIRSEPGFPVWVHGDFLVVDGEFGKVSGSNVNARSVPLVVNGTIVGKLQDTDAVTVVDKRDGWFRVIAPARFTAWVKTSDLEKQRATAQRNNEIETAFTEQLTLSSAETEIQQAVNPMVAAHTQALEQSSERPINDNDWLFEQAADSYTLQLASFDDPAKIQEFESRDKFINNPELHRFTALGKGVVWTYYLHGSYSDRELAQAAKDKIDQKLAWIRNFGLIQQNRCVAWKTQLPTPKELNRYCLE